MKNLKNQKGGFIRIIILLVIILVVGQFLGYSPANLLNNFFIPIFNIVWDIIVFVVNMMVTALREGYAALEKLGNLTK